MSAPDALPRKFGRYQLFDRIGKGGMAEIFLARAQLEAGISRLVVVKQIHRHLSEDPAFSKAFVDEAKLAAGLHHGNIAQVLDLGRSEPADGGLLFMAMEYVEGLDLHQLLRRLSQQRVPLPLEHGLLVVREVLAGLDVAHRATGTDGALLGLVHRDVSPSNVLLSFDGEVKLCDFGIAKATASADEASAGRIVGKSAYMAPEQARGETVDARADVFAAGILLWEICAGRRLYRGSEGEMLALAQRAEVPRLPAGLPHAERLQALLDRALAPDPAARLPSARAMHEALDAWVAEAGLVLSSIRFGAFLEEHVGFDDVIARRARERAAAALDRGPPVVMVPLRSSRPPTETASPAAPVSSDEGSEPELPEASASKRPAARPTSYEAPSARQAAAVGRWWLAAAVALAVALAAWALTR
jgi:serine/threonine-protein kinase